MFRIDWIFPPKKIKFNLFRYKTEYTAISTNIPTVYTYNALDPHMDQKWIPESNKLFEMSTKFIPPVDFKYEVPRDGVPEFAFVGRFIYI